MSYSQQLQESQPKLRGYIYSRVYNKSDVSDLVQTINKIALEKRKDYDESRPFSGWLFGLAGWQLKAYLKKCKRGREVPTEHLYGDSLINFGERSLESSPLSITKKIEFSLLEESENTDNDFRNGNSCVFCESSAFPQYMTKEDNESLYVRLRSTLSSREKYIFELLSQGNTNEGVANKLNITKNAANTAKSRLMIKLKKNLVSLQSSHKYDYQVI